MAKRLPRRNRRGKKGYVAFKFQCPECGRMVKGHLRGDEYQGEYECDCGAVMQAMVYRSITKAGSLTYQGAWSPWEMPARVSCGWTTDRS
jgi:lysyl-tRNA synthetase class I